MTIAEMEVQVRDAREVMNAAATAVAEFPADGTDEMFDTRSAAFDAAEAGWKTISARYERMVQIEETRRATPVLEPPALLELSPVGEATRTDGGRGREVRVSLHQGGRLVVTEPLTYRFDNSGEISFFGDLWAVRSDPQGRGVEAAERLGRHRGEMRDLRSRAGVQERAMSSTAGVGGELVTPIYLNDMYIPVARVGRPFADALGSLPLPPNTNQINVPRLASGTTQAAQVDGASVSNTDATTNYLTVPVVTVAGEVDVSRQLLERATPGLDMILFPDLVAAQNAELDRQLINGAGTGGQMKGILQSAGVQVVTFTSGSPTVALLYPKFADAIYNRIASLLFKQADAIVMHPRRWGFHAAAVDTQGRPLILPVSTIQGGVAGEELIFNPVGLIQSMAAQGVVGAVLGLPVVNDANIPTNGGPGVNQDTIIVARTQEYLFWEDTAGPYMRIFEQTLTDTMQIRLQAYQYAAFTAERYGNATALIQGTGLTPPTF